ncbi:glycine--tRNA ligase [Pyrobaculum neutrophilum]|uniref:glycine--tRNA ligase n=1 Tax=Pyrobaculum neutrophilum (strain DSM 2338 / JCM 9278 / NBRC 100436 / V24Sta) TaxID=444157 RepID=B1Y9C9_PYRNV|nr:glycine--tRNA ligase [Pyrobaculum neutrophilum]ACB40358.1 glycyl-tRNA synthetase [Pyrobaculum neutrophilum V24Sta]
MSRAEVLEEIVKKRLLYWPSSEIYGGVGGFYDYGPLGVQIRRNIVEKWRRVFVLPYQETIVEVETPVVMPEPVFKASGHLDHFTDYIVACTKCGRKYRADHLVEEELAKKGVKISTEGLSAADLQRLIGEYKIVCPACGGPLGGVETFNLLFKTTIGPYSESAGYLRPETAQGIFVAFPRLAEYVGRRHPFGVAQIGRVARNEISPRGGLIRLREFTQMEIELFFDPQNPSCPYLPEVENTEVPIVPEEYVAKGKTDPLYLTAKQIVERGYANEWMAFFMALATRFLRELGVPVERQKFLGKLPHERAHYSAKSYDQMVLTERFGWVEVSGHAYRTDYDLSGHSRYSGREMYLERRLPVPKEVEVARLYPNPAAIRERYGDKIGEVIKAIKEHEGALLEAFKAGKEEAVAGPFVVTRDMVYIKTERRKTDLEKFIPHVVEPSFGLDRIFYVVLEHAVTEEDGRRYLRLPPDVAPVAACILPIVKKSEYVEIGKRLARRLAQEGFYVLYEDDGTIGSRYALCDEIGTPLAVTIDEKTPAEGTVTVRDRDTRRQVRVKTEQVQAFVALVTRGTPFQEAAEALEAR